MELDEDHVPTKHGVHLVDPLSEKVPGGHSKHTAIDVLSEANGVVEKFPAAHKVQDDAPALLHWPIGHSYCVAIVLPASQR